MVNRLAKLFGNIFISKVYKLCCNRFVLGISFDFYNHVHLKEDEIKTGIPETNQRCITIEFLLWGVDVQISRHLTKHAPDVGDSGAIPSIFLASLRYRRYKANLHPPQRR